MSSIVWYQTKSGEWKHHRAGNELGLVLIKTLESVAACKDVNETSPMYCWLSDGWWRVNFFLCEHISDRRCEDNEVPEEVRMKNLLIGD